MTKAQCYVVLRTKSMHAARTKFDFKQCEKYAHTNTHTRTYKRIRTRSG